MSIQRQDLYIPGLIKNGRFKLLRRYIPEALFYDTNLPYIIIREISIKDKHKFRSTQVEIPELALSIPIPGRVTFRYDETYGHVIPLIKGFDSSSIEILRKYLKLELYSHIPSDRIEGILVEEYRHVIDKLGRKPQCYYLEEVDLYGPENWFRLEDLTKEWGWQIYVREGSRSKCYPEWYIRPVYPCMRIPSYINQLKSKTIAYPRIGTFYISTHYNSHRYKLGEEEILELRYAIFNSIFRYVYAEDIKIYYRRVRLEDVAGSAQDKNLVIETLKRIDLSRRSRRSKVDSITKILSVDKAPSIIGYEIKNSWGLEVGILYKRPLKKVLEDFVKCINDVDVCLNQPRKLYTVLTVCQVFINVLTYLLTKDLYLNIEASSRQVQTLLELIDAALTYEELERRESICRIITKPLDEAIEEIKSYILGGLTKLRDSFDEDKKCAYSKPLIILYILKGARALELLKSLQKIDYTTIKSFVDEIGERLKNFIIKLTIHYSYDKWILGILELVLAHSLNHHIIKHVARASGFSVNYLKEYIDVGDGGYVKGALYEAVSGGIKAIEQTLITWGFEKSITNDIPKLQKRHEDLLLTMGECPLGSAEDLLYIKFLTAKDLDIIVTPYESDELSKIKSRFDTEIQTIATIWNLNFNELKKEIIELVRHSDIFFLRFSNQDQIILTYLLNISSWSTLDSLVRNVILATLTRRRPELSEAKALEIFLNFADLIITSKCIKIDEKGEKDPLMQSLSYIINGLRRVFTRLIPRSCNTACSMCYFNRSSCMYNDPYAQILLLNRRLLKLYATYLLEELGISAGDIYSKNCLIQVRLGDYNICVPM